MAKAARGKTRRILEDVPRPSASSVMEAFYGGDTSRRGARELPLALIDPNLAQPRRHFDDAQLTALTDSIRELGLIQPILVRPVGERYEIVCGERRFRACRALAMKDIRAEVRELDADTAYRLALAENIQRDSLTPIEEALGYQRILSEGLSQSAVARVLGIDRRRVSEKLVLLALPLEAQELLSARADTFTERHARLLAQTPRGDLDVTQLARRCAEAAWSTRRLEGEIARALAPPGAASTHPFERVRYSLHKRGGFSLLVHARSRSEVARTIVELESRVVELREVFATELATHKPPKHASAARARTRRKRAGR